MACFKKNSTGYCNHFFCEFSQITELECVDLISIDEKKYCEIGFNCIPECPFSYTLKEIEKVRLNTKFLKLLETCNCKPEQRFCDPIVIIGVGCEGCPNNVI